MTDQQDIAAQSLPAKRGRPWIGFAVVAVVAVCGLFVLHGAASGAVLFAALLGFVFACIYALKCQDPDDRKHADRTGLSGWTGGF
jgi:hypothetical protein